MVALKVESKAGSMVASKAGLMVALKVGSKVALKVVSRAGLKVGLRAVYLVSGRVVETVAVRAGPCCYPPCSNRFHPCGIHLHSCRYRHCWSGRKAVLTAGRKDCRYLPYFRFLDHSSYFLIA